MKKIVLSALTAIVLTGCTGFDESYNDNMPTGYNVVVIDSCEYIHGTLTYGLSHKGNCKYCAERRKAEKEETTAKLN